MDAYDDLIQLSFAWFAKRPVTPEGIRIFIERARSFHPGEYIDEDKLFNKIESLHSVTIEGSILTLDDLEGHKEWFNVSTNLPIRPGQFVWHFWDHLKTYLCTQKSRSEKIIESLDKLSSEILSRLEDPVREGPWDRRGVVMGSVQSGKTANYSALISKAMDVGYKFIIVLAGVHNSLRSQTQERLNEELIGYDLDKVQRLTGQERKIGVGINSDHRVYTLTSSNQSGDFSRAFASRAGIPLSVNGDPIILIIKKNVTVLENLIRWLTSLPGTMELDGRKVIPDIPLLMIDDECDFASVNTKKPERDGDGKIVEEWNPTKINQLLRKLLVVFQKSGYVGYTATPYANIFIHTENYHPRYGDDLFPRHFIISLPQPSNYIGPETLFGINEDPEQDIEGVDPLPLITIVDDHVEIIPDNSKSRSQLTVHVLPNSLLEAIKAFLLVCACRRIRREGVPHNSMLVHVTRYVAVQSQIKDLVEKELKTLVARIMSGSDPLNDFRQLWETDFLPKTAIMSEKNFMEAIPVEWKEIRNVLFEASKLVKVKGINGKARDILDYREADALTQEKFKRGEEVPWAERGISVIAIGGDKLSRGLTLDGLSISYYLRTSNMYDTLMQMGRWFGYHDGYNDLCRIYTTEELVEWYRHIAYANQELRNQLEYMSAIGSTPEKYKLKVRSHPGRLVITAAGKSRDAEQLSISFSGEFPKTIVFDPRYLADNRRALHTLIDQIGHDCNRVKKSKGGPRYIWEEVEPIPILNFLRTYITQEVEKVVVDPLLIANYIEKQNNKGELIDWNVVIVSNKLSDSVPKYQLGKYTIGCVKRKPRGVFPDKISIGTLTSPEDEELDLTDKELDRAHKDIIHGKKRTDGPSSLAIRHARPMTRGLMLIYLPAYWNSDKPNYGLDGQEVVGFAISFPHSPTAEPVDYLASPVHGEENW